MNGGLEEASDSSQPVNNRVDNSVAELVLAAQVLGAIDAINKLEDLMTDNNPNDYLEYCHQLISDLEKKRDKV